LAVASRGTGRELKARGYGDVDYRPPPKRGSIVGLSEREAFFSPQTWRTLERALGL
jgi:hypothetical protein